MLGDKGRMWPEKQGTLGHKIVEKPVCVKKYVPVDTVPQEVLDVCLNCKKPHCSTGTCTDVTAAAKAHPIKRSSGRKGRLHYWNGKMYTAGELGDMIGLTRRYVNALLCSGKTVAEIMDPNRPGYKKDRRNTEDGKG